MLATTPIRILLKGEAVKWYMAVTHAANMKELQQAHHRINLADSPRTVHTGRSVR